MSIWSSAKNVVGGFFSGITGKLALYVGYAAIGMAITLGCAAIWFYRQNNTLSTKVGTLQTRVDTNHDTITALQKVNDQQDTTIAQLQTLRQTDAKVVSGLIDDMKEIRTSNATTKAKIRDLEVRSEQVKSYLNSPVPAALRSVRSVRDATKPPASSADHSDKEQHHPPS